MAAILAGFLTFGLFLGPLIARIVFDRRLDRANVVAADVRAVVRRRLNGESMVRVEVRSPGLWSPGRILLAAPSGYEDLIEKAWPGVARRAPAGYEVVVAAAPAAPAAPVVGRQPLSRAA